MGDLMAKKIEILAWAVRARKDVGRLGVGVLDNAGGMDDALTVKTFSILCAWA